MTDTENLTSALDFFNTPAYKDDEPETQKAETESEPEEAEQEAEAHKEEETEAEETPEEQPEPAKEKPEDKDPWTKTAYLDEKSKRQALEERIKLLEEGKAKPKEEESAQPEEVPEEEFPDPVSDPKGYAKAVKESIKAEMTLERIKESDRKMAASVPDYLEKVTVFKELAAKDPDLSARFSAQSDPAKFAYDHAAAYLEQKALSDPATRAKWEADMRDKLRKEILAEESAKQAVKPKVPNMPDLLNAASARSGTDTKPRLKSATDFFKS